MNSGQRFFQCLSDDIVGLVDVTQSVRFIHDHQIPFNGLDVVRLRLRELVRVNHRPRQDQEWVLALLFADCVVVLGPQNQTWQTKLVLQLLMPLRAQIGRNDNQNAPTTFGPALGNDQARFDSFSESNFVSKD